MKVGDVVMRKEFLSEHHICGIVLDFDSDGDPIIYWNGNFIEEEYASKVRVISETG